jgi:mRNA interferase RelE/StbE
MADYAITFARSARKELESLDTATIRRLWPRIEALASEPRPRGCRKLQGGKSLWRIRIGQYGVVYAIHDEQRVVDVIAVRHRSAAYRGRAPFP